MSLPLDYHSPTLPEPQDKLELGWWVVRRLAIGFVPSSFILIVAAGWIWDKADNEFSVFGQEVLLIFLTIAFGIATFSIALRLRFSRQEFSARRYLPSLSIGYVVAIFGFILLMLKYDSDFVGFAGYATLFLLLPAISSLVLLREVRKS